MKKHSFHPSIIREYDIRGEINKTLFAEDCYAIGRAFGTYVARKGGTHICLGFDGRESSSEFADKTITGLLETGINVTVLGLAPTPMVYFAMHHLKSDACMVVTGSHSPITHNGIKMALIDQPFYGDDIKKIDQIAKSGDFENGQGTLYNSDLRETYVDRILRDYTCGAELSVVWDAGNGAAGAVLSILTDKLPGKHTLLYADVDANFPNHHPDPAVADNLVDLQKEVQKQQADIGIAFDGDADRIGVVNEKSEIIWADIIMAIYAKEILQNYPNAPIIADVKSSRLLFDEIKHLDGQPIMWKTGHSLIKARMKELNSPLAGELSGHICFGDKFYGFDDGLYCAVRLLNIIGNGNKKMSELTHHLPQIYNTPEIRFTVPENRKFDIPKEILLNLKSIKEDNWDICDIDGIRLTTDDGWWLLRASNTESVLTARAEAFSQDGLVKLQNMLVEQLSKIGIDFPSKLFKGE